MVPIPDHSDLGALLRLIEKPDLSNVVALRPDCGVRPLTPEEALIRWMLNLPDAAAVARAADYALRVIDCGATNPPKIETFCAYLRQAMVAEPSPRRGLYCSPRSVSGE